MQFVERWLFPDGPALKPKKATLEIPQEIGDSLYWIDSNSLGAIFTLRAPAESKLLCNLSNGGSFQTAPPLNQKRPPDGWPFLVYMVGRTGFEPVTNWLKANCSTN